MPASERTVVYRGRSERKARKAVEGLERGDLVTYEHNRREKSIRVSRRTYMNGKCVIAESRGLPFEEPLVGIVETLAGGLEFTRLREYTREERYHLRSLNMSGLKRFKNFLYSSPQIFVRKTV